MNKNREIPYGTKFTDKLSYYTHIIINDEYDRKEFLKKYNDKIKVSLTTNIEDNFIKHYKSDFIIGDKPQLIRLDKDSLNDKIYIYKQKFDIYLKDLPFVQIYPFDITIKHYEHPYQLKCGTLYLNLIDDPKLCKCKCECENN